jgi:hypothetical protein
MFFEVIESFFELAAVKFHFGFGSDGCIFGDWDAFRYGGIA